MLGGSSGLNFMTYGRASSPEYDAWATLGSPDWNWNNLLPYFKKSETVVPGESGVFPGTTGAPGTDSQYQGKSGPIKVGYNTDSTFLSGVLAPYVESFTNVSSFANPDPVGRQTHLYYDYKLTQHCRTRETPRESLSPLVPSIQPPIRGHTLRRRSLPPIRNDPIFLC